MEALIEGSSVEDCLKKASKQYGIKEEELKYEVVKNQKHFFKRIVQIKILDIKSTEKETENKSINVENKELNNKEESIVRNESIYNAGAKVENGIIKVKNFNDETSIITIEPCEKVILLLNGEECKVKTPVSENDKIEYKIEENEAVRDVKISVTTDKLEAYMSIDYIPQNEYKLADSGYEKDLKLQIKKKGEKMPPKYTPNELKQLLLDKGIKSGILEDELKNAAKEDKVRDKLVAKGVAAIDDIPNQIKLYFSDTNELVDYNTNELKVDYRNRYMISNVKAGEVVAELIPGKSGKNGMSVLGTEIKCKTAKKILLKAGNNCTFKDNKVVSNIEGKPSIKGGTVSINQVYKCDEVNLKSGNINFVGNVEVAKNVDEGMEVLAGQEVIIGKNVESAYIKAGGQVTISGNSISSTIISGADNVEVKMHKDDLNMYMNYLIQIKASAEQLQQSNMVGQGRYGEIVKLLIENKFRNIPELSKKILKYNSENNDTDNPISEFILNKINGLGPLQITGGQELAEAIENFADEIDEIEEEENSAADVYISYSQGSTIQSSGNVIVTGKGQYTSNITALNNIEFTNEKSVCRGGVLSAGNEIILKTVGSVAGVNTILKVPKNGKITADIAYSNTTFCFGEKQMLLESASKEVSAYLDKSGEIVIDKFVL